MNYAILRTAKLKTMGNIGGSLAHNYRTIDTPNADPNRTSKNVHTVATAEAVKQAIQDLLPEKRRSDAVLCVEYLITASPEWDGWGTNKENDFFERAGQWLYDKHGKENIAGMSLHVDETTPHLVAYVVPIDQRGKLNCKEFLGGRAKLNKMQTDFAKEVKDLGLERGREGSKAKHTSIKQYYDAINKAQEVEIEPKIPETTMLESKKAYAGRVADAYKPKIATANSILSDYKYTKHDKEVLLSVQAHTEQRAKPYFNAIKGLDKDEITRVNEAMQLESRKIAVEKNERKKAMEVSKKAQTELKTEYRDKWTSFYRALPKSKRAKVAGLLTEVRNKKSPEAVRAFKNKLIKEPEVIDRLPNPKTKDRDISM